MDDHFKLNGISFVWDQAKAQKNHAKHGIAFEQAVEAFFDPFLRVVEPARTMKHAMPSSAWTNIGIC
jgi:uncharacterized DUF497 family protein